MKVIKIGAIWCNACLVMRPRWQEIEQENSWLKTQYFDYDQDKERLKKYQVNSGNLPVFIFLDKAENELLRLIGEISKDKLLQFITDYKDK